MARTNSVNFTGANQFPMASAGTDIFKKEDVQVLAKSTDLHNHSAGLGLPVDTTAIPAGALNGSKLTDGTVTSAKIQDGTIVAADVADASLTNAKLGPDVARANLLTNGGFELWQRGTSFTATGVVTADRWTMSYGAGDSLTVSRAGPTGQFPFGNYVAQLAYTRSGTNAFTLQQVLKVSDGYPLLAGTISVSAVLQASVAGTFSVYISGDGTGAAAVYSSPCPADGAWHTLTATYTVPSNATYVIVGVTGSASGTYFVDNACAVVGSQPANYVPLHPADDLARCMRYYEWITDGTDSYYPRIQGVATAASQPFEVALPFKVQKAATPTVTRNGTWVSSNTTAHPTPNGYGKNGTMLEVISSAAGLVSSWPNGAGTGVSVEANP